MQQNNSTGPQLHPVSLGKLMLLGAGFALVLILIFLIPGGWFTQEPKPEWPGLRGLVEFDRPAQNGHRYFQPARWGGHTSNNHRAIPSRLSSHGASDGGAQRAILGQQRVIQSDSRLAGR